MNFFAVLLALLCEQLKPLRHGNRIHHGVIAWVRWTGRNFDAGREHHAMVVWAITVLGPALATGLVYLAVRHFTVLLALALDVLVLYLTLGFRQFSHYFTDIRNALDAGDEPQARALLAQWQQVQVSDLPRSEIVRHVIEFSVLAAHRHVFGVLCCFSVLSALGLGPAGAVAYRLSEFVQRYWAYRRKKAGHPVSDALLGVAARCWRAVDFLPARATALCFAVVGSFEDAIDCWRNYAQRFPDDNDGVILAATSGAVNVRLGGEAMNAAVRPGSSQGFTVSQGAGPETSANSEPTPGRTPEIAHLRQVVGLVWRSVVLWMVLLVLLTLARLLG